MNTKDTGAEPEKKGKTGLDSSMTGNESANGKQARGNKDMSVTSVKQSSGNKTSQTESASSLLALQKFLADTLLELKKITWPERQQVIRETTSVIFLVALITIAVLGFDYGLSKVVFEPLDHLARQFGGGIGSHH